MDSKYNFQFSSSVVNKDCSRLINQIWKLIPMKENNEDWISHRDIIIEEICGLHEIFNDNLNFLILLSKLEGLTSNVCDEFMIYRKTIFRCIDLLSKVMTNE